MTTQSTTPVQGRLGKRPAKHDHRTLQMARYISHAAMPTIPAHADWTSVVTTWPMDLNDRLGCCTIAAVAHLVQLWSANVGHETVLAETDVLAAYAAVSGYDVATGAHDDGAYELDVLNYWQKTGIGGHTIDGFVAVELENLDLVRAGIYCFGGVYSGLALPQSAQGQTDTWSVVAGPSGEPGSWGGHAVPLVGYDTLGVTCVTWGRLQRMTWPFYQKYADESYVVLSSQDWLGLSPSGLGIDALRLDLQQLRTQAPSPA